MAAATTTGPALISFVPLLGNRRTDILPAANQSGWVRRVMGIQGIGFDAMSITASLTQRAGRFFLWSKPRRTASRSGFTSSHELTRALSSAEHSRNFDANELVYL